MHMFRSIPVATAALALSVAAQADVLVLSPFGDGYIRASQNASQTNNTSNVLFLTGNTSSTDVLRGFLQFDLSDPLLAGATIDSVTLSLFIDGEDASSADVNSTLALYQVTQSFTEAAVTWTSRNGVDNWTNPGGDFSTPALTSTVANAGTATAGDNILFTGGTLGSVIESNIGSSIGLLLAVEEIDATRHVYRFVSRNSFTADIAFRPTLTINYTTVPEPSTYALLFGVAIAGAALVRRRLRK